MIKNLWILASFCMLFLSFSCTSQNCSDTDNPEVFGKNIWNALVNDNAACFTSLALSKEEAKALIETLPISESKKQSDLDKLDEDAQEWSKRVNESFQKIKSKAQSQGISWSAVTKPEFSYTTSTDDGVTFYNITIRFSYNGVQYKILSHECIAAGTGIRMTDYTRLLVATGNEF